MVKICEQKNIFSQTKFKGTNCYINFQNIHKKRITHESRYHS